MTPPAGTLWGLLAEFDDERALVDGARRTRNAGYRHVEAYTPYPVDELTDVLDCRRTGVPPIVLAGGVLGGLGGYGLQYWVSVINYPHDIGGRPLHSWPAFIPATFECTILAAALAALAAMLWLNGLPEPSRPVFNVPAFARASRDGFFLSVERGDPLFDRSRTAAFLGTLGPRAVHEVES